MKGNVGDVVRSTAGHDEGKSFLVIRCEGAFAWICDGRTRKVEKPKKKKWMHLRAAGVHREEAAEKMRAGELHNKDVRRMLADITKIDEE